MKIIPAIDIIDGKCVRLTQGDYAQKKEYASDPLEVAQRFEKAGLSRLHIVDLDGAKSRKVVNAETLKRVADNTNLAIDFGGGIKSNESLELVLASGANQVTAGSIAAKNPELVKQWINQYGPEKIILGADVKEEEIAINGWQEGSGINLFNFLDQYIKQNIIYCICTDVSRDGLLQGPSFQLYQRIMARFPTLKLIASGGVSSMDDLVELEKIGVYGAIVGKAYYEGRVSLDELAAIDQ